MTSSEHKHLKLNTLVTWCFLTLLPDNNHGNDPVNNRPTASHKFRNKNLVCLSCIWRNLWNRYDVHVTQPTCDTDCLENYMCNKAVFHLAPLTLVTRQFYPSQLKKPIRGYTRLWRPLNHKFHFLISVHTHLCHFLSASYDIKVHDLLWNLGFFHGWGENVMAKCG